MGNVSLCETPVTAKDHWLSVLLALDKNDHDKLAKFEKPRILSANHNVKEGVYIDQVSLDHVVKIRIILYF